MIDPARLSPASARAVLHVGDSRDVLASFEPESFDAVTTDPPYGLSAEMTVGYRNCAAHIAAAAAWRRDQGRTEPWTGIAGRLEPLVEGELPEFCEGLCSCLRDADGGYLLPVLGPRGEAVLRFVQADRSVVLEHRTPWCVPRFALVQDADIAPAGGTLAVPTALSKRMRVVRDGFMGESWDGDPVAFAEGFWRECLRVLKPGGHLAAFGGTRTYHHLAAAVERAGFEIKDTLAWMYPKGMPKSRDVAADFVAKRGAEDGARERRMAVARRIREMRATLDLTREGFAALFTASPNARNWERMDAGFALPTADEYVVLLERVAIEHELPRDAYVAGEADRLAWLGSAEAADVRAGLPGRAAENPFAGWGTALRPCYEPIVLARKPLAKPTVLANMLAFGTGAVNIGASRIPAPSVKPFDDDGDAAEGGRWPANALFSHGEGCRPVAAVAVAGDNRVGGVGTRPGGFCDTGSAPGDGRPCGPLYGDGHAEIWECEPACPVAALDAQADRAPGAGPSRFYYVSKPTSREKNLGCEELPETVTDVHARHYSRRMAQVERYDGRKPTIGRNPHPTVKPVAVMRWLASLLTPPGGRVLDPFCGSGTTGVAAVAGGFEFVGIEANAEYVPAAVARLSRDADVRVVADGESAREVARNTPMLPLW